MTNEQIILFSLMAGVLGMLLWGKWRYDLVAFSALIIGLILQVIPKDQAFSGFGHPAVIIIALVLIVSRALSQSGAIEMLTSRVINARRPLSLHIASMGFLGAVLSAFMNNVAALALLMPVDMQAASKAKRSPALSLMPLSFATILGGMVTLIGTPPNIVISQFRETALGEPYNMFDFAPVGLGAAFAGLVFVAVIGWRLVPSERSNQNAANELSNLEGYVVEVGVEENSTAIDKTIRELTDLAEENDVLILGLVRNGKRLAGRALRERIKNGDLLVLEAGPKAIESFASSVKLSYSRSEKHTGTLAGTLSMVETTVPVESRITGRCALDLRLLYRHGIMLLGVSREGKPFRDRVRKLVIQPGDVLLLMGEEEQIDEVISWLGVLPLAPRGLQVTQYDKAWLSISLFAAAILLASFGVIYLPIALAACVVLFILLKVISLTQAYESIQGSVLILLASLIPLGAALDKSGGTALIAEAIINITPGWPAVAILALLMVVTMTLSDILNNVATVLVAAPVAIHIAERLQVNPDAMLMGVAVAASCAFLSPIGHKNNTIIMGPGGYRFGDYWRMGLPLEILIIFISIPLILIFWPL
ncbi:MAG: SLC13 family permease [Gammaproteobacteria bacterium]|nr:SLC13 family permease [Gammaproteobacteria bacterium]